MRKLHEADRMRLMEYLGAEPEMNLFFLGDLENFGFDGREVEFWASELPDASWDFVFLRFFESYLFYSQREDYAVDDAVAFLKIREKRGNVQTLSGKASLLAPLREHLPQLGWQISYMSRCNAAADFPCPPEAELRLLSPEDAPQVLELFLQIDEFRMVYQGREEAGLREIEANMRKGSTDFGLFLNGEMVSHAATNAENSQSAMVTGVATRKEWRGQGLASAVVSALCHHMLDKMGKRFLCLFYYNPAAGRIYRRMGFKEMGEYVLMRKQEGKTQ